MVELLKKVDRVPTVMEKFVPASASTVSCASSAARSSSCWTTAT